MSRTSNTQPTPDQQHQAESGVRRLFANHSTINSGRLADTAALALADGYPYRPDAGRTDR